MLSLRCISRGISSGNSHVEDYEDYTSGPVESSGPEGRT